MQLRGRRSANDGDNPRRTVDVVPQPHGKNGFGCRSHTFDEHRHTITKEFQHISTPHHRLNHGELFNGLRRIPHRENELGRHFYIYNGCDVCVHDI